MSSFIYLDLWEGLLDVWRLPGLRDDLCLTGLLECLDALFLLGLADLIPGLLDVRDTRVWPLTGDLLGLRGDVVLTFDLL